LRKLRARVSARAETSSGQIRPEGTKGKAGGKDGTTLGSIGLGKTGALGAFEGLGHAKATVAWDM
jgi:hypothetical protein